MKIKMLKTKRGTEDGFTVRRYIKGEVYDVAHTLACELMRNAGAYNCEDDILPPVDTQELICGPLNSAMNDLAKIFKSSPKEVVW